MLQKKLLMNVVTMNPVKILKTVFFIFSSQVENKQQSKNELELITYFNDNNKSLHCLNNYPSIKKTIYKI